MMRLLRIPRSACLVSAPLRSTTTTRLLHKSCLRSATTTLSPSLLRGTYPTLFRRTYATHKDIPSFASRLNSSPPPLPNRNPNPNRNRNSNSFSFSHLLNRIPHSFIIWGIILLNSGVFITWYMAKSNIQTSNNYSMYKTMFLNFTTNYSNTLHRPWSLITSFFSHSDLSHITFNLFTFYFMATPVLSILRPTLFLSLYFSSGIIANIASFIYFNNVKGVDQVSLGASGAVYAITSFLACYAPRAKFMIYGIVPVPAWLFLVGMFAYDGYAAVNNLRAGTNTTAHVTGMLCGAGFWVLTRGRVPKGLM